MTREPEIAMDYERASRALTSFSGLRKPPLSPEEFIGKARGDSYEAQLKVAVALDRVALWFGDDHEVYASYKRIADLVHDRYTFLTASEGEFTPEQNDESVTTGGSLLLAFKSFTSAARAEIAGAIEAAEAE